MNKRRNEQKSSKAVLILGMAALIGISGYIAYSVFFPTMTPVSNVVVEGQDETAQTAHGTIFPVLTKDPYKLENKINLSLNSHTAKIAVENISENSLVVYELLLEGSEQVVFRTGYIKPGQIVNTAYLNVGLEEGKHNGAAVVSVVDIETMDIVDIFEHSVIINAK